MSSLFLTSLGFVNSKTLHKSAKQNNGTALSNHFSFQRIT
nr:MAG TPA: hypothetical protein [Crassvirales sp.]